VAKDVPEGAFPWDEADRMFTLLVNALPSFQNANPALPQKRNLTAWRAPSRLTSLSAGRSSRSRAEIAVAQSPKRWESHSR
jgi:hypothetical protein